ncbi:MAG: hypothetical protein K0S61_3933 [Anaerocolumna sp.]|jgi:hypothetical protein|nr:hypothetical protein [Anaerocolumna sp.]
MGSFALWYSSEKKSEAISAEIHFNLWNLHLKRIPPFLDIGIKVSDIKQIDEVCFYIPFIVKKEDITDLGCMLKTAEILDAVFNEHYSVTHVGNDKIVSISDETGKKVFNIYCLDIDNDIVVTNEFRGAMLQIKVPKSTKATGEPLYLRFRLTSSNFKKIIKEYKPSNIVFQSAFSIIEALDFRFNDYRSLHISLLEHIKIKSRFNINKVHFLLLTNSNVDLIYNTPNSGRELENNIWDKYLNGILAEDIIAYHWKFKSDIEKNMENCILFIKTKYHRCNWKTIIVYLLGLGILTIFFNLASSFLWILIGGR